MRVPRKLLKRMMFKTLLNRSSAFLLIFLTIVLISCRQRLSPPDSFVIKNPPPLAENLAFDIYADASKSIIGYVRTGPYSQYAEALRIAESGILTSWPKETITFYKFGEEAQKISREQFLTSKYQDFYDQEKTKIDKVINLISDISKKRNEKSHFSIIITDLHQSDSDYNKLAQLLRDKFIMSSWALGIIGIKSEFDGIVSDIGDSIPSFYYKSKANDIKSYRPFYFLIIGQHTDVLKYYRSFYNNLRSSGMDKRTKYNFLLISPYLFDKVYTFENKNVLNKKGMNQRSNLMKFDAATFKTILQFEIIRKKENTNIQVEYDFRFEPWMMPFRCQNSSMEPEIDILRWNQKAKAYENNSAGEKEIISNQFDFQGGQKATGFKVNLSINPSKLAEQNIYAFDVIYRPREDSFELPPWIEEWNIDPHDLPISKAGIAFDFSWGAKTQNLKTFLWDLWRISFNFHRPNFVQLFFLVNNP